MLLLMDFPKPVHGMSNINLAMKERFVLEVEGVSIINTVPSYLSSFFGTKLWVLAKFIHSVFVFARVVLYFLLGGGRLLYRPVNGGFGQVYDIVYSGVSRLFGGSIFFHHQNRISDCHYYLYQ